MQRLTLDNLDGVTGLAGLADRTGVDIRPILLRVLTDLYIQKPSHSTAEERHYTELALRLIDVVDAATRATVANKLSAYASAPVEVLTRLGASPRAVTQEPENKHAEAESVDPWLKDELDIFEPAVTQDAKTDELSAPEAPPPSSINTHEDAIDYVGRRELFFASASTERRLMLQNMAYVADAQDKPLAEGTNVVRYMELAALAGRFQEFTTLLQQSLGTSRVSTSRIVVDPLGEPFVVAAKALGMPTDVFQRILMFLNPSISHSVERVYELADLFAELSVGAATHLVAVWRAADRAEARIAIHRPLHWADAGTPSRENKREPQRTGQQLTSFGRRNTNP